MSTTLPDIELTQKQLDYLKQINIAKTLREWMQHPGWEIYRQFIQEMVGDFENQHLGFADSSDQIPSRDAYWVSGVRLGGIRQFAKILDDKIQKAVNILDRPLQMPQPPDPMDFDGEFNGNGN